MPQLDQGQLQGQLWQPRTARMEKPWEISGFPLHSLLCHARPEKAELNKFGFMTQFSSVRKIFFRTGQVLLCFVARRFPGTRRRLGSRSCSCLRCVTALSQLCTKPFAMGYTRPVLMDATWALVKGLNKEREQWRKAINTDKSVRLSGPQAEMRDTLSWKTIGNEPPFLGGLSFLKRTFLTSSYWQRQQLRKYFLFCITKSCKGGQGRNSKYVLKIWNQSHVETHENIQQTRVNKDEIYTRLVSYFFSVYSLKMTQCPSPQRGHH